MPTINSVLNQFCTLTTTEKARRLPDFQTKLNEAYEGDGRLVLPAGAGTLGPVGGQLLANFIRLQDIEEIELGSGNELSIVDDDGETIEDGRGFTAFLASLTETKERSRLKVLNISGSYYSPSQLAELFQHVVMQHPTLHTLSLKFTSLTDHHVSALLPFLISQALKRLNFSGNPDLKGKENVFNPLVEQLLTSCPALQFVDLSGNKLLKPKGDAAKAMLRLLQGNPNVFVSMQDEAVMQCSYKNHYEHFLPNQFTLMHQEWQCLRDKLDHMQDEVQALPEVVATQRRQEARMVHLEQVYGQLIEQQENNYHFLEQQIQHHALKLILLERQDRMISAERNAFQVHLQQMQQQVNSTETRVVDISTHVGEIKNDQADQQDNIKRLRRSIEKQKDLLSQVDQKIETAVTQLRQDLSQDLKQTMAALIAQLTANEKILHEKISHGIANASLSQQAYMKRFQLIIIQTHLVALTGTEGTLSLNASSTASVMNAVCSIVGNFIPIAGGGASALLGYLIQSSDEDKTKNRLDRVKALGLPAEVEQIAAQLSERSVSCLVSPRQVKRQGLQQLFGAFQQILDSLKSKGFYETMFAKIADHLVTQVTQEPSIAYTNTEAEEYAESDAKLLLTAIAKEQVPMRDGAVDQHRLFLYLLPTLTSIDLLFLNILLKFCSENDKKQDQVHYKQDKRVIFCTNVAKSFHAEANLVAERLADNTGRESFINALAITFSTKEHADNARGLFYIKNSGMTVFSRDQHISIQNAALAEATTQEVLQQVLQTR